MDREPYYERVAYNEGQGREEFDCEADVLDASGLFERVEELEARLAVLERLVLNLVLRLWVVSPTGDDGLPADEKSELMRIVEACPEWAETAWRW